MRKTITSILVTLLVGVGSAHAATNAELEPCINGAVSASGSFVTQAQEDSLYLEPCIDAGVSPDGLSR